MRVVESERNSFKYTNAIAAADIYSQLFALSLQAQVGRPAVAALHIFHI
jgi:hypothetical protein